MPRLAYFRDDIIRLVLKDSELKGEDCDIRISAEFYDEEIKKSEPVQG